jgi:hypothetical protein
MDGACFYHFSVTSMEIRHLSNNIIEIGECIKLVTDKQVFYDKFSYSKFSLSFTCTCIRTTNFL